MIKENSFIIENLAKVNKIFWNDKSYEIKDCITITLIDLKALIPIKKIIDVDQEYRRLEKNLSQLKLHLHKVEEKLNNKNFIEKAPSNVIKENLTDIVHIVGDKKISMFELAKITTPSILPMTLTDYSGPPLTIDMSLDTQRWKKYSLG